MTDNKKHKGITISDTGVVFVDGQLQNKKEVMRLYLEKLLMVALDQEYSMDMFYSLCGNNFKTVKNALDLIAYTAKDNAKKTHILCIQNSPDVNDFDKLIFNFVTEGRDRPIPLSGIPEPTSAYL